MYEFFSLDGWTHEDLRLGLGWPEAFSSESSGDRRKNNQVGLTPWHRYSWLNTWQNALWSCFVQMKMKERYRFVLRFLFVGVYGVRTKKTQCTCSLWKTALSVQQSPFNSMWRFANHKRIQDFGQDGGGEKPKISDKHEILRKNSGQRGKQAPRNPWIC